MVGAQGWVKAVSVTAEHIRCTVEYVGGSSGARSVVEASIPLLTIQRKGVVNRTPLLPMKMGPKKKMILSATAY